MTQRIVSLLPSATEMIALLGFADALVGRSHECDYPKAVQNLPLCTASRLKPEQSSADIDQQVKDLLQTGVSIYELKSDVLRELQPDLIVTQAQCEVCAVSLKDVEACLQQELELDCQLISLQPTDLGEVWQDLRRLAQALGVAQRGDQLVFKLQQRMAAIASQALGDPPKVACLEWIEPLMAAGNWVPELIEMAGGDNLFGEMGTHSEYLSWQSILDADPEVLILMPCGYDLERTSLELPLLQTLPGWSDVSAVKHRRVYACDGNQFFNRPGPRLVESLEILAEILHPEDFDFGHQGASWRALL